MPSGSTCSAFYTFWGGLSSLRSDDSLNKFLYCCVNLLMIAIGAALSRRVFAVFGGLGVSFYLGHLSHTIFRDSMLFPVALTAIGLAVIAAGVYWQRHETTLGERLRSFFLRAFESSSRTAPNERRVEGSDTGVEKPSGVNA
ncbi:MAG: hypothetical protein MZV70_03055 [Desulfobacterales bacterium]|nr:hypothetical protein [Desulfobacterales bacterium]